MYADIIVIVIMRDLPDVHVFPGLYGPDCMAAGIVASDIMHDLPDIYVFPGPYEPDYTPAVREQ